MIKGFIKGFQMKRMLVVSLKTEVNGERERWEKKKSRRKVLILERERERGG